MVMRIMAFCLLFTGALPAASIAQNTETKHSKLRIELNKAQDVQSACRLTFVAENTTGAEIQHAVLETVVFDASGSVVTLSLFNFRDLPQLKPRVRQFDVQGIACSSVGRVLVNGVNTCTADNEKSTVCEEALSLESRISVELLG